MVAHIVSEKIHFDLQQQPEWQNFDLQHFEWQFFSGNTLYNNALNGYDWEAILWVEMFEWP